MAREKYLVMDPQTNTAEWREKSSMTHGRLYMYTVSMTRRVHAPNYGRKAYVHDRAQIEIPYSGGKKAGISREHAKKLAEQVSGGELSTCASTVMTYAYEGRSYGSYMKIKPKGDAEVICYPTGFTEDMLTAMKTTVEEFFEEHNKANTREFDLYEKVTWGSGGTQKYGVIIGIIDIPNFNRKDGRPGLLELAADLLKKGDRFQLMEEFYIMFDGFYDGGKRYLIRVAHKGTGKSLLYCPYSKNLRKYEDKI